MVWQCNDKYKGDRCYTPHLTEHEIKAAFLAAFNGILHDRAEIVAAYSEVLEALTDTADLDAERERLEQETEVVMGLIRAIIEENARKAQDQDEYQRKYTGFCNRFEAARNRLTEIQDACLERTAKRVKIQMFMERLDRHSELVADFDEELWYSTVDSVTVYADKKMTFTFRDGRQVDIDRKMWRAA